MEILENIGLSKNEINTYLSLLKLGQSSATRISDVAGLKRSTTYDNINSLKNKGLISISTEKGIKRFIAISPKQLVSIYSKTLLDLENAIPELEKIEQSSPKITQSQFFEGQKGISIITDDILSQNEDIMIISPKQKMVDFYSFNVGNFGVKRMDKKIKAKFIYDKPSTYDKEYSFQKNELLTQIKYIPEISNTDVISFIYGNSVAFITIKGVPTGFIIKNELIAKQQKILFDKLWSNSNKC